MPPGIACQLISLPRSFRATSFHATAAYADVFKFFVTSGPCFRDFIGTTHMGQTSLPRSPLALFDMAIGTYIPFMLCF